MTYVLWSCAHDPGDLDYETRRIGATSYSGDRHPDVQGQAARRQRGVRDDDRRPLLLGREAPRFWSGPDLEDASSIARDLRATDDYRQVVQVAMTTPARLRTISYASTALFTVAMRTGRVALLVLGTGLKYILRRKVCKLRVGARTPPWSRGACERVR